MSDESKPRSSKSGAAAKAAPRLAGVRSQLAELHQQFGQHLQAIEEGVQQQKQDVAGAMGQLPEVKNYFPGPATEPAAPPVTEPAVEEAQPAGKRRAKRAKARSGKSAGRRQTQASVS